MSNDTSTSIGDTSNQHADVIIIGAGPTGLTLANFLGMYGIRTVVLEAGDDLLDYPRAVGVDDESLRVFQEIGLTDQILPHTSPNHMMRFLGVRGRIIADIAPGHGAFGWSKRNSFIQPLVDRELLRGLGRFGNVEVRFDQRMTGLTQDSSGVVVSTVSAAGTAGTVSAAYAVGCDGGSSTTRKLLNLKFEGETESTRWLVVDIQNDPLGTPNLFVGCDPRRPYVSISLPHGVRRIELMMRRQENQAMVDDRTQLRRLLAPFVPRPEEVDVIRARVYTHHARVAARFRVGRVLLAGDAAHLMPVWQGQGFNSGIRDAANLGWKLAAVAAGSAGPDLLDTYDVERRPHATAMVKLSAQVGKVISPTRKTVALARDAFFLALNRVPRVKRYITEMRFKPMPRYERGAVVHASKRVAPASPVGRMFPQPRVALRDGGEVPLDTVLGSWFSLLVWCNPPEGFLDGEAQAALERLDARIVEVRPMTQLHWVSGRELKRGMVVGDVDGDVKRWFDARPESVVLLRPDRFVAGTCLAQDVTKLCRSTLAALSMGQPVAGPTHRAGTRGRSSARTRRMGSSDDRAE